MSLKPESLRKKRNLRLRSAGVPAYVPTIGARRRFEALQYMGWRQQDINIQAFGRDHSANWMGRETVRYSTYLSICSAYDALWEHRGPSTRVAAIARARGYSPPMAWDDGQIDDPAAVSSTEFERVHAEALVMHKVWKQRNRQWRPKESAA